MLDETFEIFHNVFSYNYFTVGKSLLCPRPELNGDVRCLAAKVVGYMYIKVYILHQFSFFRVYAGYHEIFGRYLVRLEE